MTNKQTIDGVSRDTIQSALNAVEYLALRADDIGASNIPLADELRAIIDTPPTGWEPCSPALLESGVDCATAPRWSSKEWDGHSHWHPAAQHQGDPVGWQFYQHGKWQNGFETNNHRANTEAAGIPVREVYAKQTDPVAVVLPEREMYTQYLAGVVPSNADQVNAYKDGWNACLVEVAKLNGIKL